MGVFSQCQFVLDLDSTQVPYKKKQHLRKAVTDNGGVISYILTKKTSYLVASNGAKTADTYKGRTAQKQGVPIIGVGFIERCIEEGCLLDHDDFLLVGSTASMQFGSGKITTTKTHLDTKKPVKVSSFNINKFKVWQWGSVNSPAYLEDKYEVAKCVLFQKTESRSKTSSFYQLELHVIPDDAFENHTSGDSRDIDTEVKHRFRVFIHQGVLDDMMNEDSGIREVMYCDSSEAALELYSYLYNQRHSMTRCKRQASRWIGSLRYIQTRLAILGDGDGEMSPDVASLVEGLWKEVLGELEDVLTVDIKTLTAEKVTKAESILLQIKKALDTKDIDESDLAPILEELSLEFYSQIPHKTQHKEDIKTKSVIAKKQDLCQLIKDIVSVSETTNWSQRSSVESKYRALRCHISCLPINHPEYNDIKNLILSTQGETWRVKILQVFAVTRPLELTSYRTKLHNSRLLFHASRPANFVGILSRGLVLPKVVVDDFGGKRTDAGMLGSGIYFADSFSTSAKYSHASNTRGTRLMAVNQVALGKCHETTHYQKDLHKPPEGFDSIHGVKNNSTNHSDFKDDEYVVYNTNQQRIRYLIEFTQSGDKPTTLPVPDNEVAEDATIDIDCVQEDLSSAIDLSDVQSIENPLSKIKPGLLSNTDQPIPLKAVHVRARLLDLAAQVVVLQVYANDSDSAIEAKYVFPLDEQAAVCGFEAFINDKHIVGEVKEKETAHREYKEAISKGHGAYLMDEEKPDVFTVSVGNLPPKTTVVIKITYVAELTVDGDKILFGLPGSVAPWRKDEALAQETQTDVETVKVNTDTERSLSVHVAVEMPYDIRSLESPTHPIKQKCTATKATVCLSEKCRGLDDGFQLLIGLAEIHVPRMWAERHPTDKDSQACMLTFYPEFEANSSDQSEVVLLLDLSNSMRGGSNLQEAKKLVLLILHNLPKDWKFNIVVFGTDFEELFPQSKVMDTETMKSALSFIQGLSASMGNTDVWRPLRAYFMLKSRQLRNVFLISDGHVSNEDVTLEAVRKNCNHTRVFTFGLSATANKYLLRAVSTAGAGAFEYFDNKTKSKWEGKVKAQLSKASQPVLSSVKVKWCQFDEDAPPAIQAPNHMTSLFSGSRQVVYGFVPHCTQATLTATIDGKEVSTMVSTQDLSVTRGKILHQLTARNIIRDWEEGSLATDHTQHEAKKAEQKTYIISLSKKYSIVTQFTSFVAIEVRDKSEDEKARAGVNVADLLQKEAVDSLTYLGWQHDQSHDASDEAKAPDSDSSIEELLKVAAIEASFSVLRAERLYEKLHKIIEDLIFSSSCTVDEKILIMAMDQIVNFYGNVKGDKEMVEDLSHIYEMIEAIQLNERSTFGILREESESDAYREYFFSDLEEEDEAIQLNERSTFGILGEESESDAYREYFCSDLEEEDEGEYECLSAESQVQNVLERKHHRNNKVSSSYSPEACEDEIGMEISFMGASMGLLQMGSSLYSPEACEDEIGMEMGIIEELMELMDEGPTIKETSEISAPLSKEKFKMDQQQHHQPQQNKLLETGSCKILANERDFPKSGKKKKIVRRGNTLDSADEKSEARQMAKFSSGFSIRGGQFLQDQLIDYNQQPAMVLKPDGAQSSYTEAVNTGKVFKATGFEVTVDDSEKTPPSGSLPPSPSKAILESDDLLNTYVRPQIIFNADNEILAMGAPPPPPRPPPPRPRSRVPGQFYVAFGGMGQPKAELFGGPQPSPPPLPGGRVAVQSRLFEGPPSPPQQVVSAGFGFGLPKAGLFGAPQKPSPPKCSAKEGALSHEEGQQAQSGGFGLPKAGLFGGPQPSPPPLPGGRVAVQSGLFGEPPSPPQQVGFAGFGFGRPKAGLFGAPQKPSPPKCPDKEGALSHEEGQLLPPQQQARSRGFGLPKAGLFGGPQPLQSSQLLLPDSGGELSKEGRGLPAPFGGYGSPEAGYCGRALSQPPHYLCEFGNPPQQTTPPLPPPIPFRGGHWTTFGAPPSRSHPKSSFEVPMKSVGTSSTSMSPTGPSKVNRDVGEILSKLAGRAKPSLKSAPRSFPKQGCSPVPSTELSIMENSLSLMQLDEVPLKEANKDEFHRNVRLRARGISGSSYSDNASVSTKHYHSDELKPLDLTRTSTDAEPSVETNVRITNGKTGITDIVALIKCQNEAGWWGLSPVFESIVGVRSWYISKMLIDAGVKSLGSDMKSLLEQLVVTYLIMLHLNHILESSPVPRTGGKDRENILESVLKAERWVENVERDHPLMARRLELGGSWDEVCKKLFQVTK